MLLKKLEIERQQWGEQKGKCIGSIKFDGNAGEVTLFLTPELCNQLFSVCADGLIQTAKEAAKNLTCNVIEHAKALGKDA